MEFNGATSGDLAKALSDLLDVPLATVKFYGEKLRAADMLSKKGRGPGSARMTAEDAATWLVAIIIDHERGGDFIKETKKSLALPFFDGVASPPKVGDGMKVNEAKSAGTAIACLFVDVFSPWCAPKNARLGVTFESAGRSILILYSNGREGERLSARSWVFERPGFNERRQQFSVDRTVTVSARTFAEIGKLLDLEPPLNV